MFYTRRLLYSLTLTIQGHKSVKDSYYEEMKNWEFDKILFWFEKHVNWNPKPLM